MAEKILVLDIEGTLITDVEVPIPRPGLREFLDECGQLFNTIVMMTTVRQDLVRPVLEDLAAGGLAPEWLANIQYVTWSGPYKNLMLVPGFFDAALVVLLDDVPANVDPYQNDMHVWISSYDPARKDEYGFAEVITELRKRVKAVA